MTSSEASTRSRTRTGGRSGEIPSISPVFPLLLLETMRDYDRPEEVLEDEDITVSLPRRLGLSEVVRVQIARFQEEVKHRRPQIATQVQDLVGLVIRRPDAEEIFVEAGRKVALRYWNERAGWMRGLVRAQPRPLALFTAQRAGRRMFAELVGPTRIRIGRKPISLRIDDSLTARADPGGAACGFYTGAFAQLLELYTNRSFHVLHPVCGGRRGGGECEWFVEGAGEGRGNRE